LATSVLALRKRPAWALGEQTDVRHILIAIAALAASLFVLANAGHVGL